MKRHLKGTTYRAIWLAYTLALLGCRTGGSNSSEKDIATDSPTSGTATSVFVYFREESLISRSRCPDGTVIPKRATCQSDKRSVPAKAFIDAVSLGVGTTIDAHAKNVQDLYAAIKEIDNRMLVPLQAAPAVQAQISALNNRLTILETQIASRQVDLDGLDAQIGPIKASLAARPDVDLNVQLAKLLGERASVAVAQNQLKDDEQAKREEFITANSTDLDTDTVNGLRANQQDYLQSLAVEKSRLAAAMAEVSDLNKTIIYLSQPDGINVLEDHTGFQSLKPFTRRFAAAFDALYVAPTPVAPGESCLGQAFCNFQGRTAGLTMSSVRPVATWSNAKAACRSLMLDGISGWRLPTLQELQELRRDVLASHLQVAAQDEIGLWSNTVNTVTGTAWLHTLDLDENFTLPLTSNAQFVCVR